MPKNALRRIIKQNPQHAKNAAARGDITVMMCKSAALAGLNYFGTSVEAQAIEEATITTPANFVEDLWTPALHIFLSDKVGLLGMMSLDLDLVNGIGDALTGDISPLPETELPQRDPTSTDAALCRPFTDAMLAEFAEMLKKMNGNTTNGAFKTTEIDPDPSPHSFPDIPYLSISLTVDISEGARKGRLRFTMPAHSLSIGSEQTVKAPADPVWQGKLENAVHGSDATLNAVLHRETMKISEIMKLKIGDVIEMPAKAIDGLVLETGAGPTAQSHLIARLGEFQEMRAAKVISIGQTEAAAPLSQLEP